MYYFLGFKYVYSHGCKLFCFIFNISFLKLYLEKASGYKCILIKVNKHNSYALDYMISEFYQKRIIITL